MEWFQIRDPADPQLDSLADRFGIHPLHVEDCRHRNQNAKLEEGQGYLFIVLKPVLGAAADRLDFDDLDIIIGKDWLITVEERECRSVRATLDNLRGTPAASRSDMLAYRIIDGVVDSYLPTLDGFEDRIDSLEDEVLENPTPECLASIFEVKRNLIAMRRVMANTRDLASQLQRRDSPLFAPDMWPFLRDVYDHAARNLDRIDMMRDLLGSTLDVYVSATAARTNNVMKVLTVLGTIALPMLVISGIYGMNIEGLPWAHAKHSALILGGLMAGSTAALLWALRRMGWF